MAHKKGVGSSDNGRDSKSKRLGVKLFGGQVVKVGNVIIRQRGTKYHAGDNVYMGKDHTLHASANGHIKFKKGRLDRTFVSVVPFEVVEERLDTPAKPKKAPAPKKAEPAAENASPIVKIPTGVTPAEEAPVVAAPAEEAPVAEKTKAKTSASAKITLPSGKKVKADDLKLVEGIGPKIEGLLHAAGIKTWADLAGAATDRMRAILDEAGNQYNMHDPSTWAKQAQLANDGKWEELETYQDHLKGGKEVEEEE